VSVEYLVAEAPPARRRPLFVGAAIVLVVGLVAGFLWWSDATARDANATMLAAVTTVQDQSRIGEARVMSTLEYASPMIWSTSVPDSVSAGLRELVQKSAKDASATLGGSVDAVKELRILPWQTAQEVAREAVLAYIAAVRSRLDAIGDYAGKIGLVMAEPAPRPDAALAALRASGAVENADR
jgi:hypothetical protein